ncbi:MULTISPECIES: hypothetical protein [unclassified Bradyrhizobium]|uniref:hypothetical protein n=1 Tax=unclassified Bradyrhizobium TaxID=2631580 RepID=UPI00188C86D3|nr:MULTISPECIES: hypothetical protein [unclassified Bradyrhizobium]MDN4981785.1 hypothetical protein [Bradyrhizobium sp. WYCCWR 13022]QOZ52242.1 hypothetical protein XH90_13320 [Bradyrhizobium sp. CCBAU 53338]
MTPEKLRTHVTYLSEIATDSERREVFVGLTFEETSWLIDYRERRARGESGWNRDQPIALELAARHRTAHIAIVSAEAELVLGKPTLN